MTATATAARPTETMTRACPFCGEGGPRRIRPLRRPEGLLRCGDCGSAWWGRPWSEERAQQYYHGYYDPDAVEYDPLTEQRYHAILERFESLTPIGRLLDVGCGTGHFLSVAQSRGWQGTGLEVSASAVSLLDQVKAARGLTFPVLTGDLQSAGLPAGHFRAVTLFEVIEHVDDPPALLREAARLLAAGGLLYLTTPNYDSFSRRCLGADWRVIAEEHRCLATVPALRRCLQEVGFRPIGIATKNLDVAELIARLRHRPQPVHPTNRRSASQRLRCRIEAVVWLRVLKAGVNELLRLSRLGDTIELLAVKEQAG